MCHQILKLIWIWQFLFHCFQCQEPFNVDVRFPIRIQAIQSLDNAEQSSSSFIFTSLVAINYFDGPKIFIGCPNFQSINDSFINGAVFECQFDSQLTPGPECHQTQINDNGLIYGTNIQYHPTNKSLFGMNLLLTDQHLITCAPNWVGPDETPEGICFLQDKFTMETKTILKYPRDTLVKSNRPYESHNLFGFSLAYNQKYNDLLFGLPGFKDFTGAICRVQEMITTKIKLENKYGKSHTNSYTGYQVKYFLFDGNMAILTSTPKFNNFKGKVELIDSNTQHIMQTLYSRNDTIGEFFGAALSVVDIENDENPEILVGAPLYSISPKQKEIGRVYLFKNVKRSLLGHSYDQEIIMSPSKKSGSRFGTTIEWIDINFDRFNDVIISAPFEENNIGSNFGAIYIYYGSRHGLNLLDIKRIGAESISQTNVNGFGYSVWTGTDFDSNGYRDLLIGSLMSDKSFVLRTYPIIVLNGSIEFEPNGINFSHPESSNCPTRHRSCFRVAYCIYLDSYLFDFEKHELQFSLELTVPDRNLDLKEKRVINDRLNQTIRTKSNRFCSKTSDFGSFLIELKEKEDIFDIITPIEVQLSVRLHHNNSYFCPHCPVANFLTIFNEIGFKHGCASPICVSRIILNVDIRYGSTFVEDSLVEGQFSSIDINATLINLGELSINTIMVFLMDPIHLSLIPGSDSSRCLSIDVDDNGYRCEIKKLMLTNQKEELILRLDSQSIESKFLALDFEVKTSSQIDYGSQMKFSKNITILKQAEFTMKMRMENHYNFSNFVHKVLFPISVVIEKSGPSNIDGAFIQFEVPWMIEMEQPFQYRCNKIRQGSEKSSNLILINGTLQMECAQDFGGCSRYQCKLNRFESGTRLKNFDITLSLISSRISPKIKYRQANLETWFRLLSNDTFFNSNHVFDDVKPLFIFYKQNSEESDSKSRNAIIFGSAGFGILIILLTTILLCKYGFFKRKKLEELKRVHQRMSMMNPNMFPIPMMVDNNVNEINQIGFQ